MAGSESLSWRSGDGVTVLTEPKPGKVMRAGKDLVQELAVQLEVFHFEAAGESPERDRQKLEHMVGTSRSVRASRALQAIESPSGAARTMTEQDTSFERHQLEEYLRGFIAMQNYHLDLDHRHRQIEASIETGGPLSWADEQQYDPAFIGGRNAAAVDTADNTPLEANLSQQSSTKRQPAYRARHH